MMLAGANPSVELCCAGLSGILDPCSSDLF